MDPAPHRGCDPPILLVEGWLGFTRPRTGIETRDAHHYQRSCLGLSGMKPPRTRSVENIRHLGFFVVRRPTGAPERITLRDPRCSRTPADRRVSFSSGSGGTGKTDEPRRTSKSREEKGKSILRSRVVYVGSVCLPCHLPAPSPRAYSAVFRSRKSKQCMEKARAVASGAEWNDVERSQNGKGWLVRLQASKGPSPVRHQA